MVSGSWIRAAALLAGAALAGEAQAATPLQDGRASDAFGLDPGEARAFHLDVPEDASHLKFLLEGARELQDDVDLFVRFAEPFDDSSNLFSQALYYAIGETALEHLEITFASSPPLSPGRWHALVYNPGQSRARNVTLTAALERQETPSLQPLKLDIVYTDEAGQGFNDQGSFTGQGRNNAQKLGQARRDALDFAVEMLEQSFSSPVAITVEARFDKDMESDENGGGALASAGPTFVFRDFPGARASGTWYASSIVPRLSGTDNCRVSTGADCKAGAQADMQIRFNPNVDWWYGFDRDFGNNGFDFIAVAVHEILHGLGFLSLADLETGALFCGKEGDLHCQDGDAEQRRTDAYTSQLVYRTNGNLRRVDRLSDDRRVEAFTSQSDLLWDGEYGKEFWGLEFRPGQRPPMYAPREINPGSSVSHVGFPDIMFFRGDPSTNDEDLNIREGGEALGAAWYLMRDAGWDEDPKEKLEGPVAAEVPRGMWYDRARNGHGFDFQRVGPNWFLVFFTYDDAGNPEWYLAVGAIEDGVFESDENGLQRFTYDAADNPPQSPETVGSVGLDLNADGASPACDDGVNRDTAATLARFSWEIDGESADWCAEPLLFGPNAPDPDFSGHWFAGQDDPGWGMTIQVRERDDGSQVMVDTLYFYDDEGDPRWAQGVALDFLNRHNQQAIDMLQFEGYARDTDCTPGGCSLGDDPDTSAGPLRLRLKEPLQGAEAGSRASVEVDYLGPENGTWSRDFVPIQTLSDPA